MTDDQKRTTNERSSAVKPEAPRAGDAQLKAKPKGKKPRAKASQAIDQVNVSDDALAKIIGLSAHEVPGVVGMAPASFTEGIRRILGARQVDEGVVLARTDDGLSADVDIHVVVAYGVNIPVVAESVRDRVKYAAKLYAGIELNKIRVHVAGVSRG